MATSITDLSAPCLLRVCRWLWPATTPQSYLPSLEEGGSEAGPALFGLLTSCRSLYDLVNQNWVPLFTALLEELFTPLPPHLEANYRHLLSRRKQAEEESEEERRQKDEAHQERLVIRTFFAALTFDSIKKGLASDEAEAKRERGFHIPSQLRQLLRREFAHRASNLNMEVYAARLPDVPRVIKGQPFVSAPTIAYMAFAGATFGVTSLAMDLSASTRKTEHTFGGLPNSESTFLWIKTTKQTPLTEAIQSRLDREHRSLALWNQTLTRLLQEDQDLAKIMTIGRPPPAVRLDAERVLSALLGLGPYDEASGEGDSPVQLLIFSGFHEGKHGHADGHDMTEDAQKRIKHFLLPCHVPNDGTMHRWVSRRESFLLDQAFLLASSTNLVGGAIIGWRVREKWDIERYSDSDSSLGSDGEDD